MNKYFLLILLIITAPHLLDAQLQNKAVQIGNSIPSVDFQVVGDTAIHNTAEWKDKIVVLDFWSVWCISCIEAFSKMEAIQEMLKDSIQIILVTRNTDEQVNKLLGKIKIPRPKLPLITSDTTFSLLFPYTTIPHYVILDGTGKLLHITYSYNITASNLKALVRGKMLHLSLKDDLPDFNPAEPLIKEGGGRLVKHAKFYSLLLNRLDGFSGVRQQEYKDSLANTAGLKFINTPLLQLFKFAYGQGHFKDYHFDNRTIIESVDSGRFRLPDDPLLIDSWRSENTFCYELSIPYSNSKNVFQRLQQDLAYFFPYEVSIEKRMVRCYVLNDTVTANTTYHSGSTTHGKIKEFEMKSFLYRLNAAFPINQLPIIDQSGKLQVQIDPALLKGTLPDLIHKLPEYGFKLTEKMVELNMLVIRDKEGKDITSL